MILTKIKSNLSGLLAMGAAIFAGYSYITYLHHQVTIQKAKVLTVQNEQMLQINKEQAATIATLTKQREIDDKILKALTERQIAARVQNTEVQTQLEELTKNDKVVSDLFAMRLPPDAIKLLHDQSRNRVRASGDQNSTTSEHKGEVPRTDLQQ